MKRFLALVILLAITSSACLGSTPAQQNNDEAVKAALEKLIAAATQTKLAEPTRTPTPLPTSTSTPTLAPTVTIAPVGASEAATTPAGTLTPGVEGEGAPAGPVSACIPAGAALEAGLVTRVIDANTIQVFVNGKTHTVRYIGVKPSTTRQLQKAAEVKNRELAEGQPVVLIKDVTESDKDGRLLRYVLVGGLEGPFVNYELVRQGYVQAVSVSPDLACADTLGLAQLDAAREEIGIWKPGAEASPTPKPTNQPGWMRLPEGSKVRVPNSYCRSRCR